METILGGIILALVSAFIGKAIADVKISRLITKITAIELLLVRLESKFSDLDDLKKDIDILYDRIRLLENRCSRHHND